MSRIQVSPDIHFGKPCVAGTRIPVQSVLELVREAIPFEAIIRDYYPDLKPEDIKACLQYAIDVLQDFPATGVLVGGTTWSGGQVDQF